jgi:hypothetical protein
MPHDQIPVCKITPFYRLDREIVQQDIGKPMPL